MCDISNLGFFGMIKPLLTLTFTFNDKLRDLSVIFHNGRRYKPEYLKNEIIVL